MTGAHKFLSDRNKTFAIEFALILGAKQTAKKVFDNPRHSGWLLGGRHWIQCDWFQRLLIGTRSQCHMLSYLGPKGTSTASQRAGVECLRTAN